MAAEGLGDAHDHVARLGQGGIDGQIADHAGDEAVVGVAGAEGLLQQFHAQCLDLIDVSRAGKPAVDAADVPLGRPRAHLRRQQGAHGRAGGRFGGQQVDALLAAPALVAPYGGDHRVLHLLAGAAGVENGAGVGQDGRIVDFEGRVGRGCGHWLGSSYFSGWSASSWLIAVILPQT